MISLNLLYFLPPHSLCCTQRGLSQYKSDFCHSLTTFQYFSTAATIKSKIFSKAYKVLNSLTTIFSPVLSHTILYSSLLFCFEHTLSVLSTPSPHAYTHAAYYRFQLKYQYLNGVKILASSNSIREPC